MSTYLMWVWKNIAKVIKFDTHLEPRDRQAKRTESDNALVSSSAVEREETIPITMADLHKIQRSTCNLCSVKCCPIS